MPAKVTPFESNLIRIARALVGRLSLAEALPLLVRRIDAPKCLSRNCVELVENTLAVGLTERLARMGWEPQRTQRGVGIVSGRLWERSPRGERALAFSPQTMSWLIWLSSDNFADPQQTLPDPHVLTVGDQVLQLQAMLMLQHTLGVGPLLSQPGIRDHGLIALLFPELRAEHRVTGEPDMTRWVDPEGAWVTETLAQLLCRRWVQVERMKRQSADLEFIRRISQVQQQSLDLFLDEVTRRDRWDLARWLLTATAQTLREAPPHERYFSRLRSQGLRMAERSMLYEQGLVLFRVLERLHDHHRQMQAIGFSDEGYQTSQLWKSEWERLNADTICQRASELVQQHLPLRLQPMAESE